MAWAHVRLSVQNEGTYIRYTVRCIKRCPACIRQPRARQATLCPSDWPGQLHFQINQLSPCESPPERSKERAGGGRCSPAQFNPFLPSPRHPLQKQGARAPGIGNFVRLMVHKPVGMAGRGAGVEGMGCATAGTAFIGFCCTQDTTSGAVAAQDYADCSEGPIVKALASRPYSLSNARAGSLLRLTSAARAAREAGALAWALCIASGHAARQEDTSAICMQPNGVDRRRHCKSQAFTMISPPQVPNGTFFLEWSIYVRVRLSSIKVTNACHTTSRIGASVCVLTCVRAEYI